MKIDGRRILLSLAVIGIVVGAAVLWRASRGSRPPAPVYSLAPAEADQGADAPRWIGLIGNAACAECHADIAASYARSGMARSWRAVDASSLGELSLPADFEDAKSGFRYVCRRVGDTLVQSETRLSTPPEGVPRRDVTARYQIGSGDHARAFLWEENGYLGVMPAVWISGQGEWRLSPGYELRNQRFERSVAGACIACHTTTAVTTSPDASRYVQPIDAGISCERCHGPGAEHAAAHRGHPPASGVDGHRQETKGDDTIVNPARLDAATGNDICLSCHLQGDVALTPTGRDPFSFQPGDRLTDHRLDFLIRAEDSESFGVASHGARLIQSACSQKSGRLTCFTCHDPHTTIEETPRERFVAACRGCHGDTCSHLSKAKPRPETDDCVACHMPKLPTREGQHLVATDHWIRRSAPPPSTPPIPKPDGDYELVPVWPEASPAAIRAAALVQLHLSLAPQRPSLEKGVAALEGLRTKAPLGSLEGSLLATGLIELGRPAEGSRLLEELVKQRPEDASLWLRLALARNRLGKPDALNAYERTIELSPDILEAYSPAVRLQLLKGNLRGAERLLEAQAARRLDAPARIERALVGSQHGEASDRLLSELGEALFIEPNNIVGLLLQAELLANNGKRAEAQAICRRVLELQPNHPAALNMLRQLSGQ